MSAFPGAWRVLNALLNQRIIYRKLSRFAKFRGGVRRPLLGQNNYLKRGWIHCFLVIQKTINVRFGSKADINQQINHLLPNRGKMVSILTPFKIGRSCKMHIFNSAKLSSSVKAPWNKGQIIGQKAPLNLKDFWSIRSILRLENNCRDLAVFNLAIDSKLRACNLVSLVVSDVTIRIFG